MKIEKQHVEADIKKGVKNDVSFLTNDSQNPKAEKRRVVFGQKWPKRHVVQSRL